MLGKRLVVWVAVVPAMGVLAMGCTTNIYGSPAAADAGPDAPATPANPTPGADSGGVLPSDDGGLPDGAPAETGVDAGDVYLMPNLPLTLSADDPRLGHECGEYEMMDNDWSYCGGVKCNLAILRVELPAGSYQFATPNLFAENQNRVWLVAVDAASMVEIGRVDASVSPGYVGFTLTKTTRLKLELEGIRQEPTSCIGVKTLTLK